MNKFTGYNSKLTSAARQLRREMTPHERRLWYTFLKDYPVKWYRQRPIGNYIADFYCARAKLVLELDGSQHYAPEGMEYDQLRTDAMRQHDLEVMRFPNIDIDRNFRAVCEAIDTKVKERLEHVSPDFR